MDDVDSSELSNRWDNLLIELQPQQMAQVVVLGAATGLIVWILTFLVKQAVIVPLFCSGACTNATDVAGVVATVLGGAVGLMGLVRVGVYRPLMIVIAVAIALGGLAGLVYGMAWYQTLLWSVALYAAAYAAFAWFVRIRPLIPALIVVIGVVILTRVFAVL